MAAAAVLKSVDGNGSGSSIKSKDDKDGSSIQSSRLEW